MYYFVLKGDLFVFISLKIQGNGGWQIYLNKNCEL